LWAAQDLFEQNKFSPGLGQGTALRAGKTAASSHVQDRCIYRPKVYKYIHTAQALFDLNKYFWVIAQAHPILEHTEV